MSDPVSVCNTAQVPEVDDATRAEPPRPGRRERKKAETRRAIARAALDLFLAEGYDEVSIRQVAERADVAVATVFAHFPGKEALVFDEDDDVLASLLGAVRQHAGDDVLGGLEAWFLASRAARHERGRQDEYARFRKLVDRTPALHAYWQGTWRRHRPAVAATMTEVTGLDPGLAELTAALVVEGYLLAVDRDDPAGTVRQLFDVLRDGLPGAS